jgi:cation transport regulator ChaC
VDKDQNKAIDENAGRLKLLTQQLEEERMREAKLRNLQEEIDRLKKTVASAQYAWDSSTETA